VESSLYVSLSGQVAQQKRLETIARNVANMNTAGYRADGVTFSQILSGRGKDDVAFASSGTTFISRESGSLNQTGSPLDMAVQGDGWFAMTTPSGTIYSRDGRMTVNAAGQLLSVNGYPVQDEAGQPLAIDPQGGSPIIGPDGVLTQDGNQLGRVGLFQIDPAAKLSRFDNSGVIPDIPATPVTDYIKNGVVQGYVEGANVNPILEMTKMMMVQRAFDSAASAVNAGDANLEQAIKTLGETS
jgi:flagellar basal-body rod protein FlgF